MKIHKGRGYTYSLMFHIVWVTKYRKNILHGDIDTSLKEFISKIAEDNNYSIINMETDGDHIHLLVDLSPQDFIPTVIKQLKGTSARWMFMRHPELKDQLWGGSLWSPSYFVSTVSENSYDNVYKYISDQKKK